MPHLPRHYWSPTRLTPVPAAILQPTLGSSDRPGRLWANRLNVEATYRLVATDIRAGEVVTFIRPAGVQ